MPRLRIRLINVVSVMLSLVMLYTPSAHAQWAGHTDISQFAAGDLSFWQGGKWVHGTHEGREGWWWVVKGGGWYYYKAPVNPFPDPFTPYFENPLPPSAGEVRYYCANPQGYYPYVSVCPNPWQAVALDDIKSTDNGPAPAANSSNMIDLADVLVVNRAIEKAFHGPIGREVTWKNPETGDSGTITPNADSHDVLDHP